MNPVNILGPGEYNCFAISPADKALYDFAAGIPARIPLIEMAVDVKGCLHHQVAIGVSGSLYRWGKSAGGEIPGASVITTPNPVLVPGIGNVKQAIPYSNSIGGNGVLILKNDGSVWVLGNTQTGMRGDGSQGNFDDATVFQVPLPAGVVIKKIGAGVFCAALDTTGTIWTWGSGGPAGDNVWMPTYLLGRGKDNPDYTRPGKVSLPGPAADISAGGRFNYAILASGQLYGWGQYPEYLTGSAIQSAPIAGGNTPVLLDKLLNLPKPVASLAISTVATYAILSDGSLWAWGDNACGFIGNGKEINFATYKNSSGASAPFAWDWGRMELPQSPIQIAPGVQFAAVFTGLGDVFYAYAEDVNGNLYSWGRNKNFVLGNGQGTTNSDDQANFPNSWDAPYITGIAPFVVKAIVPTPARKGQLVAIPAAQPARSTNLTLGPSAIAGSSGQLTAQLPGVLVNYWLWAFVSGPSTPTILLPSSQNPQVKGLVPGTYVFQVTAIDNNWNQYVQTLQLIVSSTAAPRKVTDIKAVIFGTPVDIPLSAATITFDDGTTQ